MSHNETLTKDQTIIVRATRPLVPVPMNPRIPRKDKDGRDLSLIYHDTPVSVKNTSYYRRQIRKGDLEITEAKKPSSSKK